VHRSAALATADRIDGERRKGTDLPVLAGIPISIKDNFDEAGVVTLAGSSVLANAPAATRDATAVARLRAAGAVLIGRTNMTEFAYSGLGINPHYGTPRMRYDRAAERIPGGSSSGAAISVCDGMYAAAIGTDTAGRRAFRRRSMVSWASSRRYGVFRPTVYCRSRSRWTRRDR
jgi:aspartyl-tRNA(Asn)/glutamyl-tRNA(Gln) amidotransferase subunit A